MFRRCGIICFSIGLWTCSDSVALFVFLWDFGTVPTVWHYLFNYGTLELSQQCGIICFFILLLDFGTVPRGRHYLFFYWTLDVFRECGIIGFSIGLWSCSDSVALFVFLLDFRTFPTVCHYWFFIVLKHNLKYSLRNTVVYMNICRITWRVTLVEQEVFTLQEHLGSPTVFKGVRAAWSYVFCVVFCRSLFVLLYLSSLSFY
jgi:hypothetical protein